MRQSLVKNLSNLSSKELDQLGREFKIKLPKNSTKKDKINRLVNAQSGGGRTDETKQARLARLKRLDPKSYYQEVCSPVSEIPDPKEYQEALEQGLVPYMDPITQEPISPDDLIVLQGICFSREQLLLYVNSKLGSESWVMPNNPWTQEPFTKEEFIKLGVRESDLPQQARQSRLQPVEQEGLWQSKLVGQHNDYVLSVAWGPDGRLASGSEDREVRVWRESEDGSWTGQLVGQHYGWVYSVAWGPDGRLASGSEDREVRVWRESQDGSWTDQQVGRHNDWVESVAWGPDGRLASGSDDGEVRVWTEP